MATEQKNGFKKITQEYGDTVKSSEIFGNGEEATEYVTMTGSRHNFQKPVCMLTSQEGRILEQGELITHEYFETHGGEGGDTVEITPLLEEGTATAILTINGVDTTLYCTNGGGSNVSVNPILHSGTKIAEISVNSNTYDIYAPNGGSSGGIDTIKLGYVDSTTQQWVDNTVPVVGGVAQIRFLNNQGCEVTTSSSATMGFITINCNVKNVSVENTLQSGNKIADITVNDTTTSIYSEEPDWFAKENEAGFIKNRTHYIDYTTESVAGPASFWSMTPYSTQYYHGEKSNYLFGYIPEEGWKVRIHDTNEEFDDIICIATALTTNRSDIFGKSGIGIGNLNLLNSNLEDTGENVAFLFQNPNDGRCDLLCVTKYSYGNSANVTIYYQEPSYVQLDENFIPSTIARSEDVPTISVVQTLTSGTKIGEITVDSTTTELFAPQGGGGSSVQSDWNQNDSTDDSYVKNRTHYKETTTITDTKSVTGTFYQYGSYQNGMLQQQNAFNADFVPTTGLDYTVKIGSHTYNDVEAVSFSYSDFNSSATNSSIKSKMAGYGSGDEFVVLGNQRILNSTGSTSYTDNNMDFVIIYDATIREFVIASKENILSYSSLTLEISGVGLSYHTLDDNFIPSTIARKAELKTVAFSGSYSDLTNRPTIPTNYVPMYTVGSVTRQATTTLYTPYTFYDLSSTGTNVDTFSINTITGEYVWAYRTGTSQTGLIVNANSGTIHWLGDVDLNNLEADTVYLFSVIVVSYNLTLGNIKKMSW